MCSEVASYGVNMVVGSSKLERLRPTRSTIQVTDAMTTTPLVLLVFFLVYRTAEAEWHGVRVYVCVCAHVLYGAV